MAFLRRPAFTFFAGTLIALSFGTAFARDNQAFPFPTGLQADVRFWTRVYTEVTTSEGFIHDNQFLNVVYERMSFSPGTSNKERQELIKNKKEYFERILLDLAANPDGRLVSARHRRVKAAWPPGTAGEEFRQAAKRLRFQLGQADRFKQGLVRSGRWLPYIKQELKQHALPQELAALPHVESSFQSDAKSHAGAAGLWQFTRSTGRRFMRIDQVVDERLDPFLATRAAALLLKDNYEITSTWPLALTAYNHGAAGMRRAVEAVGSTDIDKIVREYKGRTFGFASRNFYNAFLAALDIDQSPGNYFGDIQREKPVLIQEIELPSYYTADSLMTAFGVKNNIFKSLNPALQASIWSNNKYVPKGYRLRVPVEHTNDRTKTLIAQISVDDTALQQRPDVSYRVKRGDSLSKIAQYYKLRVSDLAALNGLRSQHHIYIGQRLKLPSSVKKQLKGAQQTPAYAIFYQVRKGDRLSLIASKAGVAESDLLALNKIKNKNHLMVGQTLRLRQDPQILSLAASEEIFVANNAEKKLKPLDDETFLRADPSNYLVANDQSITVQSNESLGLLADWLNLSVTRLKKINAMSATAHLIIGQRLQLDFSKLKEADFENKRLTHHQKIHDDFFSRYSVVSTEHRKLARGESVWLLAQQNGVPMWLLRQYNTEVNFNRVNAGTRLVLPKIKPKK